MRRWAEIVLRHRRWVMVLWAVVFVAGVAVTQTVSDRMTIDFGLPGQPGTDTANAIIKTVGNGGNTSPLLVTVTLPKGASVDDSAQQVGAAFAAIEKDDPRLRVLRAPPRRRRRSPPRVCPPGRFQRSRRRFAITGWRISSARSPSRSPRSLARRTSLLARSSPMRM